jgi:large subunit ribosomal protein L35
MGKLKTKKALTKRFKITKTGKIMMTQANRRHLLADKSPKSKRQARGHSEIHPGHKRSVEMRLPYGRKY